MPFPYSFYNQLLLRTPALSLPRHMGNIEVQALLHNQWFLEAIYLASPVLYDECVKWREGRITDQQAIGKLTRSLSKYLLRMSSRCVPFGLFSGCAVVSWRNESTSVTVSSKDLARHTRLDMHYLCALADKLAVLPVIKEHLLYYPNNSLYAIGNEWRYIEYQCVKEKRNYRISAIHNPDYITGLIGMASGGKTTAQLVQWFIQQDISQPEAVAFVEELIHAQVLISELEPAITGKEFLYQIIEILERIASVAEEGLYHILQILYEADSRLKQLDDTAGNDVCAYRQIKALLERLDVTCDENKLFQTDLIKKVQGGISVSVQQQLTGALEVLNKLAIPAINDNLRSFVNRYRSRYEDREMPLLQVLDTETGIAYPEYNKIHTSPLTGDMQIAGKEAAQKIYWSQREMYLNSKLSEALKNNAFCVEIKDEELLPFQANWNDLPASLSVMFRMAGDESSSVYVENVGGSSGANLLGRFAHADPLINDMVNAITRHEQEKDPDIIYAEVIHLPENRTGNVLLHPAFREYEIPYLAKSSRPAEYQIDVADLLVSVKENRVLLRSRRLNKQVVPRLSNAHNFGSHTLPVYRFLCDLQLQDKRGALHFNWGALQFQHAFLPRVIYKNTILYLATWNFSRQMLQPLLDCGGEPLQQALQAFRKEWKLPRYIVLCDGDNELLVDMENEQTVHIWLETIKNRTGCIIKEFLHTPDLVTDEKGGSYVNQVITVLMKNEGSYGNAVNHTRRNDVSLVSRRFTVGSEWLYYKLYCGVKTADTILLDAVKPLTEELIQRGLIDKWFFIRYNDPDFHIRVRFHLTDTNHAGQLITIIHSYLKSFEADNIIWKLQIDTYEREIERYGSNTIALSETFFYYDSLACLDMLSATEGDERENIRWLWGLRSVEELLNCFGFSANDKLSLLTGLKDAFVEEMNVDKPVKLQLDDKYRSNREMIGMMMNPCTDHNHAFYPLLNILQQKSHRIHNIATAINQLHITGGSQIPVAHLIGSYIHMMINRIVACEQRMHEMIMYDFLYRYYQSAIARSKVKCPSANRAVPLVAG